MTTFELNNHEHIGLNQLLKSLSLVSSGGEAKIRIQSGEVKVNNEVETQVRKKLRKGDVVLYDGESIEVV